MVRYQCNACNYKFNAHRQPKACPYCSKWNTVKPVATAESIIGEIEVKEKLAQAEMRPQPPAEPQPEPETSAPEPPKPESE